jgi:cytochrome P450
VFNGGGPPNALFQRSLAAAQDATVAIMAQTRREELHPDGLGARIYDAVDAGKLPADEAPVIIRSFLSAGVDTTVASLSASIYQLASHPEQWELLHQEPSRAKFAFEEAIRLESPVQTFYRVATRDVGFGGATVPTDKKILLSIAAANTDDRMFDDPYAYDITRSTSGHVGFGMGIHQCVGQHFARLEGEAVLTALATHVRAIEIVGQPARHLNNTLRSWGTLPIRLVGA